MGRQKVELGQWVIYAWVRVSQKSLMTFAMEWEIPNEKLISCSACRG